ncbi:hypothetical protein JCM10449v2_006917 [Rhodotorula kratochvilovae]
MTASRPRRASSTAASPPDAAGRAAVLLAASEGVYALRKRGRADAGLEEDDSSPPREGRGAKRLLASGKRPAGGGKAPKKAAKTGGKSTATGSRKGKSTATGSRKGKKLPSPAKKKGKAPAKKTSIVARADVEVPARQDDGDDSSLTSLSDLEPDPQPTSSSPRALPTSPLEESDDDDDDGSVYVDDEDGDKNFSPSHPGRGSPSTYSNRKKPRKAPPQKMPAGARERTGAPKPAAKPSVPAKGPANAPQVASNEPSQTSPVSAQPPQQVQASILRRPSLQHTPQVNGLPVAPTSRRPSLHLPPGAVRCSTDFKPLPMPTIMELFERRRKVLDEAIYINLQQRSEDAIESAVEALQTGAQQTTLCLAMNRYTAFCGDERVKVPVFPLTCAKIALFLARCTATPTSSLLLSVFPQPETYPLPIADCLDPNLTADEGNRLTRELAKCWIDALAYAQTVTLEIWAPVLQPVHVASTSDDSGLTGAPHPSLRSLHDDRAIREILGALEPAEHMDNYEARMRARNVFSAAAQDGQQAEPRDMRPRDVKGKGKGKAVDQDGDVALGGTSGVGKTKWLKGGKAVAPPNPSIRARVPSLFLREAERKADLVPPALSSSSSSGGSHAHPQRSTAGTSAASPEMHGGRAPETNEWATSSEAPFPRINAFAPADSDTSITAQEPTFAGHFSDEPAFAPQPAVGAGDPFEPAQSQLDRRSSTSNPALSSVDGTSAFPLPPHAAAAFASASDSPSHLPLPSSAGPSRPSSTYPPVGSDSFVRARSMTHDPRIHPASSFSPSIAKYPSTSHGSLAAAPYQPAYQQQSHARPVEQYHSQPHRPYPAEPHLDSPRSFASLAQPNSYGTHAAQPTIARAPGAQYVLINGAPYLLAPASLPPTSSLGAMHGGPFDAGASKGLFDGASEQVHPSLRARQPHWSGAGANQQHSRPPSTHDWTPSRAGSVAPPPDLRDTDLSSGSLHSGSGYASSSRQQRPQSQSAAYDSPQVARSSLPHAPPSYAYHSRTSSTRFAAFDDEQQGACDLPLLHELAQTSLPRPPLTAYLEAQQVPYAATSSSSAAAYPPPQRYGAPEPAAPTANGWRAILPDPSGPAGAAQSNAYPTPESPSELAGGEFPGAGTASLGGGAGGLGAFHLGAPLAQGSALEVRAAADPVGLGIALN